MQDHTFSVNKSALQFSISSASRIKEICKPLERYLGITYFAYFRLYNDCKYLALTNACSSFMEKAFFTIKSQDQGSIKALRSVVKGKPSYYIWPIHFDVLPDTMVLLAEYNVWHGFNIMYRHEDYCESFNFAFNKQTDDMTNFYSKNSALLTKFATYFKMQAADLLDDTNTAKLACYPEKFDFSYIEEKNLKDFLSAIEHDYFLKSTCGDLVNITKREVECLRIIAQGKTLKAAANLLSISPRTVECHINNIKNKIGVNYKNQLIDIVNSVNYLNPF